MNQCPECLKHLDRDSSISHFEKAHVGPSPSYKIRIKCLLCPFSIPTENIAQMADHFTESHRGQGKVSYHWEEYIKEEEARMTSLLDLFIRSQPGRDSAPEIPSDSAVPQNPRSKKPRGTYKSKRKSGEADRTETAHSEAFESRNIPEDEESDGMNSSLDSTTTTIRSPFSPSPPKPRIPMFGENKMKTRSIIIGQYKAGKSLAEIKRSLKHERLSKRFVERTIERFEETGGIQDKPRNGRPRNQRNPEKIALVAEKIKENPNQTLKQLSAATKVSVKTLTRMCRTDIGFTLNFKNKRNSVLDLKP